MSEQGKARHKQITITTPMILRVQLCRIAVAAVVAIVVVVVRGTRHSLGTVIIGSGDSRSRARPRPRVGGGGGAADIGWLCRCVCHRCSAQCGRGCDGRVVVQFRHGLGLLQQREARVARWVVVNADEGVGGERLCARCAAEAVDVVVSVQGFDHIAVELLAAGVACLRRRCKNARRQRRGQVVLYSLLWCLFSKSGEKERQTDR